MPLIGVPADEHRRILTGAVPQGVQRALGHHVVAHIGVEEGRASHGPRGQAALLPLLFEDQRGAHQFLSRDPVGDHLGAGVPAAPPSRPEQCRH